MTITQTTLNFLAHMRISAIEQFAKPADDGLQKNGFIWAGKIAVIATTHTTTAHEKARLV